MDKLTTERLDEIANIKITEFSDGTDTANGAYQSVGSSEIVLMARQLLACEQAAKNPAAWVATDSEGFPEYSGHNEFSSSCGAGTPLYSAPVLPLLSIGELLHRLEEQTGEKWVEESERPVIPGQLTQRMAEEKALSLGAVLNDEEADVFADGWNACRAEMLKAQLVSEPYKLNCWISVADRLPSEFGRYLCYVEEQNDLGKSHYQWNCSWNGDVFSDSLLTGRVTHWMPLPAAPAQESE